MNKVFIVALSAAAARGIAQRLELSPAEYHTVRSPDELRGLRQATVFVAENTARRSDWREVNEQLCANGCWVWWEDDKMRNLYEKEMRKGNRD